MGKYTIAVIVGSVRRESLNRKLAIALAGLAPPEFSFKLLDIGDIPIYNYDKEDNPPEQVRRFKSEIKAARGVLFVTPEYNRSIPGVLKNAIDQASRPYGQSAWAGKPAGVTGISSGPIGTTAAQQHLRNILAHLDMPTLGQPEVFLHGKDGFFDSNGEIADPKTKEFLQGWMDRYTAWIKKHAA
jgi:chromate reductase